MNLKNYTSQTKSEISIARIEKHLVQIGARNINKEYEDQILRSIKFLLDIKGNTIVFSLPARVEVVFDVFWKEVKRPRPDTKQKIQVQAEMTAWKIIADWTEIQCSMIYLEQAEPLQVFLPYAMIGETGQTFYEKINSNMKLLK